jgi:hypothetical protein
MIKKELLQLFEYKRERGVLVWKSHWDKSTSSRLVGTVAGTFDEYGYRVVRLKRRGYKIHQIIWFLETGFWSKEIDHKDGQRANNHIENLREVDRRGNAQNRKRHRSGRLVGATKRKGGWESRISIDGQLRCLGTFRTELEAHRRYFQELNDVRSE